MMKIRLISLSTLVVLYLLAGVQTVSAQRMTITTGPTAAPPRIDLKANGQDTLSIPHNTNYTLSWSGTGLTSCTATNNWYGAKAVSGTEVKNSGTATVGHWNAEGTAMVDVQTNFSTPVTISCTTTQGLTVSDTVTIYGIAVTPTPSRTPTPTPHLKINIKSTTGAALTVPGNRVCQSYWGGSIAAGTVGSSNCATQPASSFTVAANPATTSSPFLGMFMALPAGWTLKGITSPDNEREFYSVNPARDSQGSAGFAFGFERDFVSANGTGYSTLNLVVAPPAPTVTTAPACTPGAVTTLTPPSNISVSPDGVASGSQNGLTLKKITPGARSVVWSGSSTGLYYLRIDDTSDGAFCTGPKDYCPAVPATTSATSYSYTFEAGKTYYAYVHTANTCGQWSQEVKGIYLKAESATVSPSGVPSVSACPKDCSLNVWGDANCDTVIDSFDAGVWQSKYLGETKADFTDFNTDFNKDGKTSLLDFQVWVQGFFKKPAATGAKCSNSNLTPTVPPGCRYVQVQCVRAPCPPMLECVSPTPTTAAGALPFNIANCTPATQDTYVSEQEPTKNFGTEKTMRAGADLTAAGTRYYLSYFQFDSTKLSTAAGVKYRLWVNQTAGGGAGSLPYAVNKVTSSWNEGTLTWNTRVGWDETSNLGTGELGDNFKNGWNSFSLSYNAAALPTGLVLRDSRWKLNCSDSANSTVCRSGASRGSTIVSKETGPGAYLCWE